MTTSEVNSLVEKCISGDRKAQFTLYKFLAPKLSRVCFRYIGSQFESQDVLQDVFVKIFSNLNRFNSESSLITWATRIAINTSITNVRLNKKYIELSDIELDNEPFKFVSSSNQLDLNDTMVILSYLPVLYKNIFLLFEIEGYSYKEISEILEIKESTCRVYLLRAKEKLVEIHKKINLE